eukprot:scaffold2061_cov246-Pinguiococcus_pyrenoidosus.AAC.15
MPGNVSRCVSSLLGDADTKTPGRRGCHHVGFHGFPDWVTGFPDLPDSRISGFPREAKAAEASQSENSRIAESQNSTKSQNSTESQNSTKTQNSTEAQKRNDQNKELAQQANGKMARSTAVLGPVPFSCRRITEKEKFKSKAENPNRYAASQPSKHEASRSAATTRERAVAGFIPAAQTP